MTTRPAQPRSRWFWPLALVGWTVIAYGGRGLFRQHRSTNPTATLRLGLGLDLVHDLVVVPIVLALGAVLVRVLPQRWRAPVTVGLILSATTALYAYPFVRGFGRSPTTPSRLPNNYATGLASVLAGIWLAVAIGAALIEWQRARR